MLKCEKCSSDKLKVECSASWLFTIYRFVTFICKSCKHEVTYNYSFDMQNCLICDKKLNWNSLMCRECFKKDKDVTNREIAVGFFTLKIANNLSDEGINYKRIHDHILNSIDYKIRILNEVQNINSKLKKASNEPT